MLKSKPNPLGEVVYATITNHYHSIAQHQMNKTAIFPLSAYLFALFDSPYRGSGCEQAIQSATSPQHPDKHFDTTPSLSQSRSVTTRDCRGGGGRGRLAGGAVRGRWFAVDGARYVRMHNHTVSLDTPHRED